MKPVAAMWEVPALPEVVNPDAPHTVTVAATLKLPCRVFSETVRTAKPGRLALCNRWAYRLAGELPAWVEDLARSPVEFQGDSQTEALEVGPDGSLLATTAHGQGMTGNERRKLTPRDLWGRFLTFGAEFTPEQRRDFSAHPAIATALREAALTLARDFLGAFKSALDRGRWLHDLAQGGALKGWTPEVLAAGYEGFLEALQTELDALPGHKAPALLIRLAIPTR